MFQLSNGWNTFFLISWLRYYNIEKPLSRGQVSFRQIALIFPKSTAFLCRRRANPFEKVTGHEYPFLSKGNGRCWTDQSAIVNAWCRLDWPHRQKDGHALTVECVGKDKRKKASSKESVGNRWEGNRAKDFSWRICESMPRAVIIRPCGLSKGDAGALKSNAYESALMTLSLWKADFKAKLKRPNEKRQ